MSEAAPEVAVLSPSIATEAPEFKPPSKPEPQPKTEKETLTAEALGERLKEIRSQAQASRDRLSRLGELVVFEDSNVEIQEGEEVPTVGQIHQELEEASGIWFRKSPSTEEYCQQLSPVLERANGSTSKLTRELFGMKRQIYNSSGKLKLIDVEIDRLADSKGAKAWWQRRNLRNQRSSIERQIAQMEQSRETVQRQINEIKQKAELIRTRQQHVFLEEMKAETKKVREAYQDFLEKLGEHEELYNEISGPYIERVIVPKIEAYVRSMPSGYIKEGQKEKFYDLLRRKSMNLDHESEEAKALDQKWDYFMRQTEFQRWFDDCLLVVDSPDGIGHRNLIQRLVGEIAIKDLRGFYDTVPKKSGKEMDPTGVKRVIEVAISPYRDSPEGFRSFTEDSCSSTSRRSELWRCFRESETAQKIFGDYLTEKDEKICQSLLDGALSGKDTEGLYYYPTPETIKILTLIAAAGTENARTFPANKTLTRLAERDDWPNLLDQAIEKFPELAGVKEVLTEWQYDGYGNNPEIEGKMDVLALSVLGESGVDERLRILAYEALSSEKLLQRLTEAGDLTLEQVALYHQVIEISAHDPKNLELIDFGQTIEEAIHKQALAIILGESDEKRTEALAQLEKLTIFSRQIIESQKDKNKFAFLAQRQLVFYLKEVDEKGLPFLLQLFDSCPAYFEDEERQGVLWSMVNANMSQLLTQEGLEFLQGIGQAYREKEHTIALQTLVKKIAELEAVSPEKRKEFLTESYLIRKEFLEKINPREAVSIVDAYLEKAGEELDPQVLETAVNYKCFPMGIGSIEKLLAMDPELKAHYEQLKLESRGSQWADVIDDNDIFWQVNLGLFVYLKKSGFTDFDFKTFRSIVNNPEVEHIFVDESFILSKLGEMRGKLGMSINQLHYLAPETVKKLMPELEDEFKARFYRQLLAESPRSFKNAVYSISENSQLDINQTEVQKRIRSAINQIGNITPIVLRSYVAEDNPEKRLEFIERLKRVKTAMLKNEPVRGMFADLPDGDDLLAEFITLSFPGNSFESVRSDLFRVGDQTEDLADFKIKEDGYEARSESRVRVAVLREGRTLDRQVLEDLKLMFPRFLNAETKRVLDEQFERSIAATIKRAGAFSFQEVKDQLPAVLSILYGEEAVIDFRKTNLDLSQQENVSVFLERAQELLGIYFKDNFEQKLGEVLGEKEDLRTRLETLLSQKRIQQIEENFARLADVDKTKLSTALAEAKEVLRRREQGDEKVQVSPEAIASLVSVMIENRILRSEKGVGLRRMIARELEKFEYKTEEGEATAVEISFKGHVSKNAASYFAKRTAGICTAGDIDLYNRPDHFHINLVKDEVVVGNIQGYMIEHKGKKGLLFRGFNPSVSLVNRANAEVIGDGMMSIVIQFARDNGINDVFVTEQYGGWHALTNRSGEGVLDYFEKRYLNPKFPGYEEINLPYSITKNVTITKMYRVPMA